MTMAGLTLLLAGLVGQQADATQTPAKITMVAVQALVEGREFTHIDPRLNPVRKAIERLDFDSFYQIKSLTLDLPYGQETKIEINSRYTLHLEPESQDSRGRVRVQARILMASSREGSPPIEALRNTSLLIVPGKFLNLGGLRLKEGELIIVLRIHA